MNELERKLDFAFSCVVVGVWIGIFGILFFSNYFFGI